MSHTTEHGTLLQLAKPAWPILGLAPFTGRQWHRHFFKRRLRGSPRHFFIALGHSSPKGLPVGVESEHSDHDTLASRPSLPIYCRTEGRPATRSPRLLWTALITATVASTRPYGISLIPLTHLYADRGQPSTGSFGTHHTFYHDFGHGGVVRLVPAYSPLRAHPVCSAQGDYWDQIQLTT